MDFIIISFFTSTGVSNFDVYFYYLFFVDDYFPFDI